MNTLQYSESQLLDTSFPASTSSLNRGATMNGAENGRELGSRNYPSDFFERLFGKKKAPSGPADMASLEDISPDTSVQVIRPYTSPDTSTPQAIRTYTSVLVIRPTRAGLRDDDDWYTNARSLPRTEYGYRTGLYAFSLFSVFLRF